MGIVLSYHLNERNFKEVKLFWSVEVKLTFNVVLTSACINIHWWRWTFGREELEGGAVYQTRQFSRWYNLKIDMFSFSSLKKEMCIYLVLHLSINYSLHFGRRPRGLGLLRELEFCMLNLICLHSYASQA